MDSVKEWLTLPEVAWVNDPDREEAKVIEELLVKHVFGDSGKSLVPGFKVDDPGVRVRLYIDVLPEDERENGGHYGRGAQAVCIGPDGKRTTPESIITGYLELAVCKDARNSGKTSGMIELNHPRYTPMEVILGNGRSPVVSLYHSLPTGETCRVQPLDSLEVAEKDLLIHLDNMRRFVKGNQAQEKRLEQLVSGTNGPEQVAGLNTISVPVESLAVPIAPPAEEVEQGEVEAVVPVCPTIEQIIKAPRSERSPLLAAYYEQRIMAGAHKAFVASEMWANGTAASYTVIDMIVNGRDAPGNNTRKSQRGKVLVTEGLELLKKMELKQDNE